MCKNSFLAILRSQDAMDFETLRNNVILETEKNEERLMSGLVTCELCLTIWHSKNSTRKSKRRLS